MTTNQLIENEHNHFLGLNMILNNNKCIVNIASMPMLQTILQEERQTLKNQQ